jgi:hypothetical protein
VSRRKLAHVAAACRVRLARQRDERGACEQDRYERGGGRRNGSPQVGCAEASRGALCVQASDRRSHAIILAFEGRRERAVRTHADVHPARELKCRLSPLEGERRERQRSADRCDDESARRIRRGTRERCGREHDARRGSAGQHVLDAARKTRARAGRAQRGLDRRGVAHRPMDSIS